MNGPDRTALETYFRLMNSNGAAQVYHAALELGIYGALERGPAPVTEIAQACGANERAITLLMAALEALGLAEPRDALGYGLTDAARMLLSSEYRELGNQYWRHLSVFFRTGQPLMRMDDPSQSESLYQAQAAALGWMLSHAANEAARRLESRTLLRGSAIIDIGAGSGIWSLTIARHDSEAHVTAVDWPAVLEVTRKTASIFKMQDRLTTIAGDFHEIALPDGRFDLAIVANVSHLQSPDGNVALFCKLHASLKPGGEIVVIDALPGGSQGEAPLALYQLGLALRTQNGRVYSASELAEMLKGLFDQPSLIPIESPPHMMGMLIARKPS